MNWKIYKIYTDGYVCLEKRVIFAGEKLNVNEFVMRMVKKTCRIL